MKAHTFLANPVQLRIKFNTDLRIYPFYSKSKILIFEIFTLKRKLKRYVVFYPIILFSFQLRLRKEWFTKEAYKRKTKKRKH